MKAIKTTTETIMTSFNKAMPLFQWGRWATPVISNFSFPVCQEDIFHQCFIDREKSGKRVLLRKLNTSHVSIWHCKIISLLSKPEVAFPGGASNYMKMTYSLPGPAQWIEAQCRRWWCWWWQSYLISWSHDRLCYSDLFEVRCQWLGCGEGWPPNVS